MQKKVKWKLVGDGLVLEVGSMVLARYPVDEAVYTVHGLVHCTLYRARVEKMIAVEEDLFR